MYNNVWHTNKKGNNNKEHHWYLYKNADMQLDVNEAIMYLLYCKNDTFKKIKPYNKKPRNASAISYKHITVKHFIVKIFLGLWVFKEKE